MEGAGFEVVGQAGDGEQLIGLVRAMRPDLVVTDIRMPPTNTSEVLALMAEGRSNAVIAHRIWVTEDTVEKHIRSIMNKLSLPETGEDHRRVVAVLAFLDAR